MRATLAMPVDMLLRFDLLERLYLRRLHCFLVTLVGLLLTPSLPIPTENSRFTATALGAIVGLDKRTGNTLSPFHQ